METTVWSPDMVLGNVGIDRAHQDLFEQMVLLFNGADSELDTGLPLLVDKLERDFREEEELMEGSDFDGIRSHREEHARVLGALHHIEPGDTAAQREALKLMLQWFPAHLATQDKVLADALGRAAVPAPASSGAPP